MLQVARGLAVLVLFEHVLFLMVEMFLWKTERVRKNFGMSETFAVESAALAANQGLYNGFLAAGLAWGLWFVASPFDVSVIQFFLRCVIVAGLFGGFTVKKSILVVQALPALAASLLLTFSAS